METRATFKNRFLELCGSKTQQTIAEAIGVSRATVGYYMSGDRSPDIEILSRIAKYFDVTSDYLLGLSDNKKAKNTDIGERLGLSDEVIESLSKPINIECLDEAFYKKDEKQELSQNIDKVFNDLYIMRREFLNLAILSAHFDAFMYFALESKKCYELKQAALTEITNDSDMQSFLEGITSDNFKFMLILEAVKGIGEPINREISQQSKEHGNYALHYEMNLYRCEKAARDLIEDIITSTGDNNADD